MQEKREDMNQSAIHGNSPRLKVKNEDPKLLTPSFLNEAAKVDRISRYSIDISPLIK